MQSIPEVLDEKDFIIRLHKYLSTLPEIVNFNSKKETSRLSLMEEVSRLLEAEKPEKNQLSSLIETYFELIEDITFISEMPGDSLRAFIQCNLDGCVLLYEHQPAHPGRFTSVIHKPLKTFPEHFESLASQFIAYERGFRALIPNQQKFLNLARELSAKDSHLLIKMLIDNPLQYRYLVNRLEEYENFVVSLENNFAGTFALIPSIYRDKAEFTRLVTNSKLFIWLIKKASPEQAQNLMTMLLSEEAYERLVPNIQTLLDLKEALPDKHAQALMAYNPFDGKQYRRLITDFNDFLKLATSDPELAKNLMVHDNEFKRLIDMHCIDSFKSVYKNKSFSLLRSTLLERALKEGCFTTLKDLPRESFLDFMKKLDRLYDSVDRELDLPLEHHSSISFLWHKKETISELYAIFGKMTFGFLTSKLVNTPVPIQKYFSSLPSFDTTEINFYANLLKPFHSQLSKQDIHQLSRFFAHISAWDFHKKENLHALINTMTFKKTGALLMFLYDYCLKEFLKDIDIKITELNLKVIKEKLPIDKFLLLQQGFNSIEKKSTRALMIEMLKADLDPDRSFEHFANSTTNNTAIGTALAEHNRHCAEALRAKGINPKALDYPYVKKIKFGEDPNEAYFAQCKALLLLVHGLKEKPSAQLQKAIIKFQTQLLKGITGSFESPNKEMFKRMQQKPFINLIKKIANNLDQPAEYSEINTRITQLENSPPVCSTKKSGFKEFEIKAWDKNKFDTFFLGSYLSCCLSPDSGNFAAMIMRRAGHYPMHVIENEQGEPICGNCLFFTHDADKPENVYVVATFVAIRVHYSLDRALRHFLYESLCDFTKAFAKEIGAKDFFIKVIDYGSLESCNSLSKVSGSLKKIGGFFNPCTLSTEEKYVPELYLTALSDRSFYKARPLSSDYSLTLKTPKIPENVNLIKTLGLFNQNKTENTDNTSEYVSAFEATK